MRSCAKDLFTVGDNGNNHNPQPLLPAEEWQLKITGDIATPTTFTLEELWNLEQTEIAISINCVSAGKLCGRDEKAKFTGVHFSTIANLVTPNNDVQSVIFISKAPGNCGPKTEPHHTALELDYCMTNQVLLTATLNNQPLPYKNGWPLRTIVGPDRYFFKSIKWLEEIQFTSKPIEKCKGTWETYAGYHNIARVEHNERFEPFMKYITKVDSDDRDILQNIPESEWQGTLRQMYQNRDFSRLTAAKIDFAKLLGTKELNFTNCKFVDGDYRAKLRGINFKHAIFYGASMEDTNFSLCIFTSARFSKQGRNPAQLDRIDLEGANFLHACLENVSMKQAYLTGVKFYSPRELEGKRERTKAKVKKLDITEVIGLDEQQQQWLTDDGAI